MHNDMSQLAGEGGDLDVSGTESEGLSHVAHGLLRVPSGSSGFKVVLRLLAQDPVHRLQGHWGEWGAGTMSKCNLISSHRHNICSVSPIRQFVTLTAVY